MATAGDETTVADSETRFAREYVRPGHVFETVRRSVLGRRKGYVALDGPLGAGRSFALRGLAGEGIDAVPVLTVTLARDERLDRDDFMRLLAGQARERWGVELTLPRARLFAGAAIPFAVFLHDLMRTAGLERLLLAIDGVDEPGTATMLSTITSLPPAHRLPDGCFVVFSSGPGLAEHLAGQLDELRASVAPYPGGITDERETPCFDTVALAPDAAEQRAAVRAYLALHLPERLREPAHVDAVLERSEGLFLNAFHLARALHEGLFTGIDDLPAATELLPELLARLRQRTGAATFDAVHLPLLALLSVARAPLTAAQLVRYGVPAEAFTEALAVLRDFILVERGDGPPRYIAAHTAVARWVAASGNREAVVREAHRRIARAGLEDITTDTPEPDPYAVSWAYHHAEAAADQETEDAIMAEDAGYFRAYLRLAASALAAGDLHLADERYAEVCESAEYRLGEKPELRPLLAEAREGAAACSFALDNSSLGVAYMESEDYPAERGMAATAEGGAPALVREHAELYLQATDDWLAEGMPADAAETVTQAIERYERLFAEGELPLETLVRTRLRAIAVYDEADDEARAAGSAELAIEEIEAAGRPAPLTSLLAELYRRRGRHRIDLAQWDGALAALETAVSIAATAPAGSDPHPARVAARALVEQAEPLAALERHEEEVERCERAAALLRPLAEQLGGEVAGELALTLTGLSGRLVDHERFEEALAPADEALAIATRQLEAEPNADRVTGFGIAAQARARALGAPGAVEEQVRALDEASGVLRRLAERGVPAALSTWAVLEFGAGEALADWERNEEALPRLEVAVSLRERARQEEGPTGQRSGLLHVRTLRAEVLAAVHGPEAGLEAIDAALREYGAPLNLFGDDDPLVFDEAREVRAGFLEVLGRTDEAARPRRGAASLGGPVAPPLGEEIVPGVHLAPAAGNATLTLTDAGTGRIGTSIFLDHHAIATLRSDLRGWSGANWLSPDRDLQVRSRGRQLELTAHPDTAAETRRTLAPEEAATFRERINALYDEGRVH